MRRVSAHRGEEGRERVREGEVGVGGVQGAVARGEARERQGVGGGERNKKDREEGWWRERGQDCETREEHEKEE